MQKQRKKDLKQNDQCEEKEFIDCWKEKMKQLVNKTFFKILGRRRMRRKR